MRDRVPRGERREGAFGVFRGKFIYRCIFIITVAVNGDYPVLMSLNSNK